MSTRCCASSNRHRHQEPTTTSYPRPSHSSSRCATGCRGLSEKLTTHLHATTSSTFWTNLTTPCRQTSPLSFAAKKQSEFIQDHCRRAPHHFALHFKVGRHQGEACARHNLARGDLVLQTKLGYRAIQDAVDLPGIGNKLRHTFISSHDRRDIYVADRNIETG